MNLVRTSPEHLTNASQRRSMSLVRGTSRALSESEPEAKLELSANQSGTHNECKLEAQHEFSKKDRQNSW